VTSARRQLPQEWLTTMDLPLICAPMFLVSNVAMLIAASANGIIGAMPSGNARTAHILDLWLQELTTRIEAKLGNGRRAAPWALNLVVHSSNRRLPDDLALCAKYRAPLVITALGSPRSVVDVVHGYGGIVFADVSSIAHAHKAVAAGVDGLVLVCSGAGGHTGQIAAPAFVAAVRAFWGGLVVVAGGMTDGRAVRAMQTMGADLAYMGTRFIASRESSALDAYKRAVVTSSYTDIICTDAITGAWANMLVPSLTASGLDPDRLRPHGRFDLSNAENDSKPWRDLWSAGHGVGAVAAIEGMTEIIDRLKREYAAAIEAERADPWAAKYHPNAGCLGSGTAGWI